MKGVFLIPILTAISCLLWGQSDTLNRTDSEGMKQGYWIIGNDVKKLPNYSADAIVEEGGYIDRKKDGLWKMYYPSGAKKSEITFKYGHPNGPAKMYYESGCIQEEGIWENNRWCGEYKQSFDNCKLKYQFNHNKKGKRDGAQLYYGRDGVLYMKVFVNDGHDSLCINYDKNGNETFRGPYGCSMPSIESDSVRLETHTRIIDEPPVCCIDPKPFDGHGPAKLYRQGGKISKEGTFKNFRLMDGKDYIYNEDGILIRIAVYKKGKYVGDAPMEE